MNEKDFKKDFDTMVNLGLNPLCGEYTISGACNKEYQKYAKNRLQKVKDGLDRKYIIVKEIVYKIIRRIK